ncbi:MAG: nuclear transport factor 2 family protein [Thermomicrobiales bacterium]
MQANVLSGKIRYLAVMVMLTGAVAGGLMDTGSSPANATALSHAQEASTTDLSGHPMVGTWLATTPSGLAISTFAADGSVVMGVQPTRAGPQGVAFVSAEVGTWEPTGERSIHFTALQILSNTHGAFLGTVTIDGHPVVSEDGQSLLDDGSQATVTIRDASNAVVDVIQGGQVTAVRMGVGAPGFAAATDAVATPAQSTEDPLAEADRVRATEHERLRALVEADVTAAEPLHTDDFQLINPFGETLSKEAYLGSIASGAIDYLIFEPTSEIAVRTYGDTAVVRYQSRIEIVVDGQRLSDRGWHTDVYEMHDGGWQIVWSQMTEIV